MKVDLEEKYEDGILLIPENAIPCYACLNFKNNKCEKLGELKSVVSSECDEYRNIIGGSYE